MPVTADQVIAKALAKRPGQQRRPAGTSRTRYGRRSACRHTTPAASPAGGASPAAGPVTTAHPYRKHSPTGSAAADQGAWLALEARTVARSWPGTRGAVLGDLGWRARSSPPLRPSLGCSPPVPAPRPPRTRPGRNPRRLPRPFATLPAPAGSDAVESAAFKPGTVTLAAGMFNGDVDLWDTTTRKRSPCSSTTPSARGMWRSGRGAPPWPSARAATSSCGTPRARPPSSPPPSPPLPMCPGKSSPRWRSGLAASWPSPTARATSTCGTRPTRKTTAALTGPADNAGTTLAAFGAGGFLAVGYGDGDVYLWDTTTEFHTTTCTGPPGLAGHGPRDIGGVRFRGRHHGRRLRQWRRLPLGHHELADHRHHHPSRRQPGQRPGGVQARRHHPGRRLQQRRRPPLGHRDGQDHRNPPRA